MVATVRIFNTHLANGKHVNTKTRTNRKRAAIQSQNRYKSTRNSDTTVTEVNYVTGIKKGFTPEVQLGLRTEFTVV